ncbi:MAG TPA: flagellum-specific ATP synthase FliI, partial [Chromatiales bacterium]|nr:flagellum-specific ATP synthase FliI [Chromatiales bacterium]
MNSISPDDGVEPTTDRSAIWTARLNANIHKLDQVTPPPVEGKLTRMVGLTLEAVGCRAAIGGRCLIK